MQYRVRNSGRFKATQIPQCVRDTIILYNRVALYEEEEKRKIREAALGSNAGNIVPFSFLAFMIVHD